MTDIKFFYEQNWFSKAMGIFDVRSNADKLRIPERAVVHYTNTNTNKDYYIGFRGSKGRGNEENMWLFKSMRRNMDATFFTENFYSEDQSYSIEAFSMAVHIQDNTALYGPLTEKAWYSNGSAPRGTLKFASKISEQKQKRHLERSAGADKSYLSSVEDAQKVLDAYNKGQYTLISEDARQDRNTVTIQVNKVTGMYVNIGNPNGLPDINVPTNEFMIQSPQAPKVVPVNPNKGTY
ncbi:polymorphic toxin type 50 domain-containing protein [Chitinophaga silvisoli]|uniref:Bacterial toxin 50 domain-containing protein n=1 Tax=Chitinophaga silvisoli TaxID=2291814 RepID=A0A3E1NMU4_9BACT|nr:polymorphic toxin type 50 domain-containing protein [Chitinophaga silvisoli]RFM29241.1 hypothetical protein DXN04_33700 [Chitinophaga silvisoli]